MPTDDPRLSELMVERVIPTDQPEGFLSRHQKAFQSIRDQIMGGFALLDTLEASELGAQIPVLHEKLAPEITQYKALKALDNYLNETEWQYKGERKEEHQEEILGDILDGISVGQLQGHVDSATSTGKAYLIAKLAEAFSAHGMRVLVLAPKKVTANQLVGANGTQGIGKFAPHIPKVDRHFGGDKATAESRVVASTYQSLNNFAADGSLGEFDVVLADEAHLGLGEVTSQSLKSFSPNAIKIGFTATPEYGSNKSVREIFPNTYHELGLREAIEGGKVSAVEAAIFTTGEKIRVQRQSGDFTDNELSRLIHLKSRNNKAIEIAKNLVSDNRQGVVSCVPGAGLAHARLLMRELNDQVVIDNKTGEERNIVAAAVGSHLTDEQNELILKEYEAGNIDVLTFVNQLTEGWDSQKASFLINLCPTTSIVKIKQLLGRVIRKKDDVRPAIVIDFVDESVGKAQKTALHALGEEAFELGKVFGAKGTDTNADKEPSYLCGILNSELYAQLESVDGKLLSEITIPPKQDALERMQAMYERQLTREGLGEEMSIWPPQIKEEIDIFYDEFCATYHHEPSDTDVFEHLYNHGLIKDRQYGPLRLFNSYLMAEQVELAGKAEHIADDNKEQDTYKDPEAYGLDAAQKAEIERALASGLDEKQQAILRLRFGNEATLRAIGDTLGVGPERVRQQEARALSILRHPNAANLRERDAPAKHISKYTKELRSDLYRAMYEIGPHLVRARNGLTRTARGRGFDSQDVIMLFRKERVAVTPQHAVRVMRVVNMLANDKDYESPNKEAVHLPLDQALLGLAHEAIKLGIGELEKKYGVEARPKANPEQATGTKRMILSSTSSAGELITALRDEYHNEVRRVLGRIMSKSDIRPGEYDRLTAENFFQDVTSALRIKQGSINFETFTLALQGYEDEIVRRLSPSQVYGRSAELVLREIFESRPR